MCVCVCKRERERERERMSSTSVYGQLLEWTSLLFLAGPILKNYFLFFTQYGIQQNWVLLKALYKKFVHVSVCVDMGERERERER